VQQTLTLAETPYDSPLAEELLAEVQQEYVVRYGGPDASPMDGSEFLPPSGVFLVAAAGGATVGCAGLRRHDDETVEIKRMYVRAAHRRAGHARRMLAELEDRARQLGFSRVILETGAVQPEALALYESSGYERIPGFGHYKDSPLSRSFAKSL
jgi:GNAT superfamily N-acetyltransferase